MNCLSCNATLATAEWKDVEVDYCPECGGVWLDEGELELLLRSAEAAKHYLHSLDPGHQNKEKQRKCPICRKKMEIVLCGRGMVPVDKCAEDHGLWCDSGELHDILKVNDAGNPKVMQFLQQLFAPKK
jgi:Zn-finger nucleic acid-binding protein